MRARTAPEHCPNPVTDIAEARTRPPNDIYFNDDQSECIVHQRYRDSEALIEHTAHLGDLMEAILATGSVSGELLGEPSAELRAKMADSEVRLFTPFQSM